MKFLVLVTACLAASACKSPVYQGQKQDPYEQYLWLVNLGPKHKPEDVAIVLKAGASPFALIREGAVVAAGKMRSPELAPLVVEHLSDPEARVRIASIETVAKVASARSNIHDRLRVDSSPEVRRASAKALKAFPPDRSTYAALVAALEDPDGGVSVLAHESLTELSGQKMGRRDLKAWQEWVEKATGQ